MKKPRTRETQMMNTGKIVMGFSLVMISIAMMVSPSGATGPADPSDVGGGIAWSMEPGDLADMHTGRTSCPHLRVPCTDATYPYER